MRNWQGWEHVCVCFVERLRLQKEQVYGKFECEYCLGTGFHPMPITEFYGQDD